MFIPGVEVLGLGREYMRYLGVRQKILAENVANADTPQATRKDLVSFTDALRTVATSRPATTHPAHFASLPGTPEFRENRRAEGYALEISENDIVLEQEMVAASEVRQAYAMAARVMRSMTDMMGRAFSTRS